MDARKKLREIGFSAEPKDIIRRTFVFSCEHGSHSDIIAGQIIGLAISFDEVVFELYISTPMMWGISIKCLIPSEDSPDWLIATDEMPQEQWLRGKLEVY